MMIMSVQRSLVGTRNFLSLGKNWNAGRGLRRKGFLVHTFSFTEDNRRQYTRNSVGGNLTQSNCIRWFGTDKKPEHPKTEATDAEKSTRFWSHWLVELQRPPNVITATRILCTPILSYWIVTGNHELALGGCVLAAASDWLDGYLAKHHDMGTVLGAYLDPMADKIFINVLSASLWYTNLLPGPLVALWLARDVLLIVGAASFVRSRSKDGFHAYDPTVTPLRVNPTNLSKANTVLQFVTVGIAIVFPLYNIPVQVLDGFCYLTGFTTIASGVSYLDYSAFTESGNEFEDEKKNKSSNTKEKEKE